MCNFCPLSWAVSFFSQCGHFTFGAHVPASVSARLAGCKSTPDPLGGLPGGDTGHLLPLVVFSWAPCAVPCVPCPGLNDRRNAACVSRGNETCGVGLAHVRQTDPGGETLRGTDVYPSHQKDLVSHVWVLLRPSVDLSSRSSFPLRLPLTPSHWSRSPETCVPVQHA